MSETDNPDDVEFDPVVPSTGEAYDPVDVFAEAESMDLRPGADNCYKCSTCDTNCPVAAVDDGFPGPKFQGPEQWRLKQTDEDYEVDGSVMDCSNCMRCDSSCPSGVPLSQMHNAARAQYVDEQMSRYSLTYWRNRVLANYRTFAKVGSAMPRVANFVLNNSLVQAINERLFGITSERDFPPFARQTFREWFGERGGAPGSRDRARAARRQRGEIAADGGESADGDGSTDKRVAYFHGCYANYNTPQVGKALVRVFEHFGYEVVVPARQGCSGTPMFANGFVNDARRHAEPTVETFADLVDQGFDAVCSCTSCSMALRQEWPELFDYDGVDAVSANTFEAVEYLRIHEDLEGELDGLDVSFPDLAYHAPCHARNQGIHRQAVELFEDLEGVAVTDAGQSCSGISGTYGWKAEKYDVSMEIGEEMFEHMEAAPGETGLTECPTCAMQMEHGTGYEIRHPLEVLEAALVAE